MHIDISALMPGDTGTGEMTPGDAAALQKALTAGYGTDQAQLTGGAALRLQSLDPVLQAVIEDTDSFKLFAKLTKGQPTATVDEWTEQSSIGGHIGGTASGEVDEFTTSTGEYARRTGFVKYLTTKAQVSIMQTFQRTHVDGEAAEYSNAALRLLRDAESFLFEGNSEAVPTEFDGIKSLLVEGVASGYVDRGNIINLKGMPLEGMTPLNAASMQIRGRGNFGRATDVYLPLQCQMDLDSKLDPAFRVVLGPAGTTTVLGAPVTGVKTTGGVIGVSEDVWLRGTDDRQPWQLEHPVKAAANNAAMKPQTVTPTASSDVGSEFGAPHAGNYYYAVAGLSRLGQSEVTLSAQVAVAAGDKVQLSIVGAAGAGNTGYVIYRSRRGGANSVAGTGAQGSDFREIARIKRTGGTTVFTDLNEVYPGTVEAYVLNLDPAHTALQWRQFVPMFKLPLAIVNAPVISWAQIIAGYLRMSKRRHHVMIRNILPTTATWQPFPAV
jgi:hypothetical protein